MSTEPMKWSYTSKILPYLRSASIFLDMGTGGGEYLTLLNPLPEKTYATELYKPNIPIAKERLKKLGVKVMIPENDQNLPFDNNFFDLITNKHESFDNQEVIRILKLGAVFITQQVGETNFSDMNELFGVQNPDNKPWNVDIVSESLKELDFDILYKNNDHPKTRFYDLGAILFFLKAIPWQISDFSIEKYKDKLQEIFDIIHEKEFIEFNEDRFIIIAEKG